MRHNSIEIRVQGLKAASIGVSLLFVASVACAAPHTFLVNNAYSPVLLLAGAISGWIWLREAGSLIVNSGHIYMIGNVVCYIGMHTMPILIFHFLAFKIVSFVLALVYGYPLFVTGACPVAFKNSWAWIPYTVCGVGIPLAINAFYMQMLAHCERRKS